MKNIVFSAIGMGAVYPVWIWDNPNPSPAMAGQEYQRWWGSLFRSFQNFTSLVHSQGPQGPLRLQYLGLSLSGWHWDRDHGAPSQRRSLPRLLLSPKSIVKAEENDMNLWFYCIVTQGFDTPQFILCVDSVFHRNARTLWMKQIGVGGFIRKTSIFGVFRSEVHRQWLKMQPERSWKTSSQCPSAISRALKNRGNIHQRWNPGAFYVKFQLVRT